MTISEFDKLCDDKQAEIQQLKLALAKMRKERPTEVITNPYRFKRWDGDSETMADLFQGRNELIVVHNMGIGCDYCTLWADGFNGFADHLNDRAAFVVVSNDSIEVQQKFAASRGWRFKMVSSEGTSFFADMGFWGDGPWPGISTFKREVDGTILRTGRDNLGEGDDYCSVWHIFTMLHDDYNDWSPKVDKSGLKA